MKTMRKLFAMVLALTMVLAMATTAGAATVTVENAQAGATYKVYQLLEIKESTAEGDDAFVYVSTEAWKDFWTAKVTVDSAEIDLATYFTINSENVVVAKAAYDEAAAATVAKAAKAYAEAHTDTISATSVTADENASNATVTVEKSGYYLLTSTVGNLCTLATLDTDNTNLTLREKNKELPTIEKTIETGSYKIGDDIAFKLTVTTEENINNEKNYIIHDTMSKSLTLKADTIKVSHGTTVLTKDVDYTVNNPGTACTNGCTFEIVFTDKLTTKAYDTITVEYTATLNENATDTTATNDAAIDESKDDVTVQTYEFTVEKIDDSDAKTQLTGAEFKLYSDSNCTTEIPVVQVAGETNTYRPAVGDEEGVAISAGKATITGLSVGTYYLKETKAPDGYVKDETVHTITLTDANNDGTLDTAANEQVVNTKGEELPETGGMGTTLFYIVGGLMVAGAAILLVTKKRMGAAE